MLYYKWIGSFVRDGESVIKTMKMCVPHKSYAYGAVNMMVMEMIEEGWTSISGDLYQTDSNYNII